MTEDSSRVIPFGEPWRMHLGRGLEALRAGDAVGADEHLARARTLAPRQPEVLLGLARRQIAKEDHREAVILLEEACHRAPASAAAAAMLARSLGLALGERQRAFAVLHEALERLPEALELHVIRGELLLEENEIEAARAAFARAFDANSAHEAARIGLARTYNAEGIALSEDGYSERAVFTFKRAADLDPRWSGPHVNMGVVFFRLGRLQKAVESYEAALLQDPENPVAYFNLGTTYHRLGRLEQALAAFEDLLVLQPDYPQLRISLANVLGDRRDFDAAITLLLEEVEIAPDSVEAWTSLGLAYTCSGNSARGEECLLEALARDASHFNAYHNLAVIYAAQGRSDDARSTLERAFGLDPSRTRSLFESDASFDALRGIPAFAFLA